MSSLVFSLTSVTPLMLALQAFRSMQLAGTLFALVRLSIHNQAHDLAPRHCTCMSGVWLCAFNQALVQIKPQMEKVLGTLCVGAAWFRVYDYVVSYAPANAHCICKPGLRNGSLTKEVGYWLCAVYVVAIVRGVTLEIMWGNFLHRYYSWPLWARPFALSCTAAFDNRSRRLP